MLTLKFLTSPRDARDFITSLGDVVLAKKQVDHSPNLASFTLTLDDDTYLDDITIYDLGNLEALRFVEKKTKKYTRPIAKRTTYKNGARYKFIRKPYQRHGFSTLSDELVELDHVELGKRYNFEFTIKERIESPFVECCVLAMENDNLGALIKSRSLADADKEDIAKFCLGKAKAQDEVISRIVSNTPKWEIRRKARNVKRRLLRALLYRECSLSLQATKGSKFSMLVNLAKNKGLL